jgi:hypothetical protein
MPFPAPGTPAWGHMNQRRAELIRKKLLGTLSPREHHELDYLQEMSARALAGLSPTTDELLAPFRQHVQASGMTDDDLDCFFQELRHDQPRPEGQ